MPVAQLDIHPDMIEQVENRLLDAIVEGTLAPGLRLTQESVASMFGVSRQPVSHALQALKRRGLVVEHGKRGLAIAPLEAHRIRDLYQVRAALDGVAAELAATLVRRGRVAPAEIERARKILAKGQALATDAPMRARIDADVQFHSAIHQLSGNAAIGETVASQWPHFMRSMRLVLDNAPARARVWREHAAILDAILSGTADAAASLAREHTLRAGEETAARLELPTTASLVPTQHRSAL